MVTEGLIVPLATGIESPGSMTWFQAGGSMERSGESGGTSDNLVGVELTSGETRWLHGLLYGRKYAQAISGVLA
jgi:hypothetical protein